MARARNIKPGFFLNEKLAELHPLARILFIGLWCVADREGRLEDRPKRIKAEILPYDECDVDKFLTDLHNAGFIVRYKVNGSSYIQVLNFKKHQNPHVKEKKSTIPPPPTKTPDKEQPGALQEEAPEKHSTSTVQAPEKHSKNPADSGFLIPDSGYTDSKLTYMSAPDGADDREVAPAENLSKKNGGARQNVSAGKGDEYTEEFESFWSIYPRKVKKKAAFKKWKARLKEGVKPEVLMQAALHYAQECRQLGTEERYIKHATTFLGADKHYEDYINGPTVLNSCDRPKSEPRSWGVLRQMITERSGPG